MIKFCGDLADQPSSVVVQYKRDVRNQRFRVRYWVFTYKFSIFFNLVQKNSKIMASLVYGRENCSGDSSLQTKGCIASDVVIFNTVEPPVSDHL